MKKKCVLTTVSQHNGVIVKVKWMDDNKSVRLDVSNCGAFVLNKIFPSPQNRKVQFEMQYEK